MTCSFWCCGFPDQWDSRAAILYAKSEPENDTIHTVQQSYPNGIKRMSKRWILCISGFLLLAGVGLYSYQRGNDATATRAAMLAILPSDASAVLFADVAEIRSSAFAAELYKWAPQPQVDPEYTRFLRDTGFDYERDLDRVAIAMIKRDDASGVFAVADGRFDQAKIEAYATQSGSHINRTGHQIYSVNISGSARRMSFTFLRADRIALTDDDLPALLTQQASREDAQRWRDRFERLAGSPIFAVLRQEAFAGSGISSRAPGGLQSPQLATLLDQLLWVTLAGKPEGDRLRVIAEGEYGDDRTARQLSDVLNGMLVLAQAGLNGPDTRRKLNPLTRDAYLEILRSADVSRIDRGETKSVRVIFDVTPTMLQAARTVVPAEALDSEPDSSPKKNPPARPRAGKHAR